MFFGDFFGPPTPDPNSTRPLGSFLGAVTSLNGIDAPDQAPVVPEPASLLLIGSAIAGLGVFRAGRKRPLAGHSAPASE